MFIGNLFLKQTCANLNEFLIWFSFYRSLLLSLVFLIKFKTFNFIALWPSCRSHVYRLCADYSDRCEPCSLWSSPDYSRVCQQLINILNCKTLFFLKMMLYHHVEMLITFNQVRRINFWYFVVLHTSYNTLHYFEPYIIPKLHFHLDHLHIKLYNFLSISTNSVNSTWRIEK